MGSITKVEDSATISTTEYDIIRDAAYSSGSLTAGPAYVSIELDADALLITDTFTFRVRADVNGDVATVNEWVLQGPYTDHVRIDLGLVADYAVTIIRTTGADRSVGWKILTDAGAPTAAENAAAVEALETASLTPWLSVIGDLEAFMAYQSGVSTWDTAQTGSTSTTIKLASGASSVNDFYVGQVVLITAGTGRGQCRMITGYVGSTKVATVSSAWATTPDATSWYAVHQSGAYPGYVLGAAGATAAAVAALPTTSTISAAVAPLATSSALSAVAAQATAIETDTQDIQSRIPAALDGSGNMKAGVQSIVNGAVTAAAIASDAFTAAKFAADVGTEFAAAVWDSIMDDTHTAKHYMRGLIAGVFGKVVFGASNAFKRVDGTTTAWTVATDATGRTTSTPGTLT